MKRFLILVVSMLAALPVLALEHATELRRVPGPPATLADMLAEVAAMRSFGSSVAADNYSIGVVIPAVVNAPGKNGTDYTTAFFALNGRNVPQQILIGYSPAGVSGVGLLADRFVLDPNTSYAAPNFLGPTGLNKTGVGSLIINAVITGTNTIDPNALIYAGARISTPQPGSTGGTTSFSEWAVAQDTVFGSTSAISAGVLQDMNNRANAGTVNLSPNPLRITLTILGGGGAPTQLTYDVPPMGMQYFSLPSDLVPSANGYFTLVYNPGSFTGNWYPFAVSANNPTGDGYFLGAIQFRF